MASFSVSVTDIKYASDRTGYKDVTITNAPAAGVTVTITSGSSYFDHRIPEAGVYRIYTLSVNSTSSWIYGTARFTNNNDNTDYVEISLSQYPDIPQVISVETESDKLYVYDNDYVFAEYNPGSQELIVYCNENMTDRTESANWVSEYDFYITDTGFLRYRYFVVSNYDPYRECTLSFYKSGTLVHSILVCQNGYPSSTSGCTSPIYFEGSGGNRAVTVKTTASNVDYDWMGDSEFVTASSTLGTNQVNYVVTAASNISSDPRRGTMWFYGGSNLDTLGFTNILQAASVGPVPTLSASPSYLNFGPTPYTRYITLAYADPLTTNMSSAPSWLSIRSISSTDYVVDASSFSTAGSTRSWNWELQDANMSLAVPITQTGPDPQTLSISPTSDSVSWINGTTQITVTSTGITVNYTISVDWIQISSVSGDVYTFSYTRNTTSSSRTGTITFYGGELSETYTLTQGANVEPSITVSPTTQNVSSSGGSVTASLVTNNIDTLTYSISDSWVTFRSNLGLMYNFDYTANTSTSSRTAVVTFTGTGSGGTTTATYTIVQEGAEAYLSISPTSSIENGEYYSIISITVSTNISNVTYNISDTSWIQYMDLTQGVYRFRISANSGSSTRTGTITFSGGGLSQDYTVTQLVSGEGYLNVYPGPYTHNLQEINTSIGYPGGTFDVIVDTNLTPVTYTIGDNHIQFESKTDNIYTFRCGVNSSSINVNSHYITFYAGGLSKDFRILQFNTSDSYINITPDYDIVGSSAGTVSITTSGTASSIEVYDDANWINLTSSSNPYVFSYDANTSSSRRYGKIGFRCSTADGTFRRVYALVQEGYVAPTPILSVTPTSDSVTAESGSVTIMLRTQNVTSVTYSSSYPWIHYVSGSELSNVYVFSYDANTGAARTGTITFTATGPGGSTSRTYTLSQAASGPTPQPVLVIDPTSQTVDYHMRAVRVTVYTENIDTVSYNIEDTSWLQFSSIPSPGQYSFIVNENTGSSSRTNTVTFTGGGLSRTYTLTQEGTTPPTPPTPSVSGLEASPASLRYYSTSSTQTVSFNMPMDEVTYSIIYTEGQDWLSTSTAQNGINFTASVNAGNKRSATIRFYEIADPTNYVDVPVIQGSGATYWDSIWVENIFTPNVQDDYHYNITISNPHFNGSFEGLTPIPYQGIDVPRLVEDYISSSFEPQVGSADWASMYTGYCMASIYNLNQSTPVLEGTYSFWNDWSGKEKRYDYTKSINDPINHKGTSGMIIPFCVYADSNDNPSFSTLVTDMEGNTDTNTYSTPLEPFNMRTDVWYNVKNVDYRLDDQVLFSYDMTHCGDGAFIYRNRFGGWDSFLIEGNISKTDNYTKLNYKTKGIYNSNISNGYNYNEKRTSDVDIDTTYEAYTGWLTDDEAERLVFHLASSPKVYFQDLVNPSSDLIPIRMTLTNAEYKKFRNGRRLVNYTILFEKAYTEKLKD